MLALEQCGHDKFLPALGNDDLRFTMASIREAFAPHVAATATLERVRAVIETPWHNAQQVAFERITDALAGQPEAPRVPNTYEVWRGTEKRKDDVVLETTDIELAARTACADLSGQTFWGMKRQPEAPKGQEEPDHDCSDWAVPQSDLAAAKAQIGGLERALSDELRAHHETRLRELAANARADAAERDREATRDHVRRIVTDTRLTNRGKRERLVSYLAGQFNPGIDCDLHSRLENEVLRLEHERDQLAALAAERGRLLYHYTSNAGLCTPEERAVLEACKNATISEDDHGDDDRPCFDLDDAIDVTAAELANRAAKAKRERSTQEDIGPPLEQSKAKRGGT
jgi:hypothetical protein